MPTTPESSPITASMLYSLVACPHRVSKDLFADPHERDEINPFIELLWEKGTLYEDEVIKGLKLPFLDLRSYAGDEKFKATLKAMAEGVPLIYSARIQADDLLGDPDLLRKEGAGYAPIDIKSGAGEEGGDEEEDGKPKKSYAVQLSLYVDILERLGLSAGRTGYIWDVRGEQVPYKLDEPRTKTGKETLWQEYQKCLTQARGIVDRTIPTLPAYAGVCKLCHWHSACLNEAKTIDDLTLIPELGRARRDAMMNEIPTVRALAECNPEAYFDGKKTRFSRVGPDMLVKFHKRARLLSGFDLGPYIKEPIILPSPALEIFFDIEVDTMRDLCYLHGFVERLDRDNSTEKYIAFFMEGFSDEGEEKAFGQAWSYLQGRHPCVVYHYAPYERTWWKKLQSKYPHVCSAEEVDVLFDPLRTIDLYSDVVRKKTEWPTNDHSIKTLAKSVGFNWRDTHPSGAASVRWFDEWAKSGDPKMKQRILDYNEDDCVATRWILDRIRGLAEDVGEKHILQNAG
jgi:predicted RecB family nuclease